MCPLLHLHCPFHRSTFLKQSMKQCVKTPHCSPWWIHKTLPPVFLGAVLGVNTCDCITLQVQNFTFWRGSFRVFRISTISLSQARAEKTVPHAAKHWTRDYLMWLLLHLQRVIVFWSEVIMISLSCALCPQSPTESYCGYSYKRLYLSIFWQHFTFTSKKLHKYLFKTI